MEQTRVTLHRLREQGIRIAIDGVENADTAAWLREHGCDIAQGYFHGLPVDIDTVLERFAPRASATPGTAPASAKSN